MPEVFIKEGNSRGVVVAVLVARCVTLIRHLFLCAQAQNCLCFDGSGYRSVQFSRQILAVSFDAFDSAANM